MKHVRQWWDGPLREVVLCLVPTAALDFFFHSLGFMGLIPTAGPKNALPLLLGLLYGPAGAAGCGLGTALSALLRLDASPGAWWEALCVVAVSLGAWRLWYLPGLARVPLLKKGRDLLQYLLFVLVSALALGTATALWPAARYGLAFGPALVQTAGSAVAWSLLVGMPAHITLTSVFAVVPRVPACFADGAAEALRSDLRLDITALGGIEGVTDAVEAFNETHGVSPRQGYALMSCAEELALAVLEHLPPEGRLTLELWGGAGPRLRLRYGGERYDPLAVKKNKTDPLANLDILGILMVREMAASASYRRRGGSNEIQIIV